MASYMEEVFEVLREERRRQCEKWNRDQSHWPESDLRKLAILVEEVGEVAQEVVEDTSSRARGRSSDRIELESELIQAGAVIVAWLESIYDDRVEEYHAAMEEPVTRRERDEDELFDDRINLI